MLADLFDIYWFLTGSIHVNVAVIFTAGNDFPVQEESSR